MAAARLYLNGKGLPGRLLDGMVRYRFGENAELMGAWVSARNVLGRSGRRVSRQRLKVRRPDPMS